MIKRIVSLALSFAMVFSLFAYAEETSQLGLSDEEAIAADLAALTADSLLTAPLITQDSVSYLIDSLSLPASGANGSAVEWQSSVPDVISSDGVVTRPAANTSEVTLTASLTKGSASTEAQFVFNVAPLSMKLGSIPALEKVVHGDDFTGSDYNSDCIKESSTGGSFAIEDGKMKMERSKDSGNAFVRFWAEKDTQTNKTQIEGNYYIEYVMTRTAAKTLTISFRGGSGTQWGSQIASFDWEDDGQVTYYDIDKASWVWLDSVESRKTKLKLGLLIDAENDTYSLYLDNEPVVENIKNKQDFDNGGFKYSEINIAASNYPVTLEIDSYRIWKVARTPEEIVAKDAAALTKASILSAPLIAENGTDYLIDSLNLPSVGTNGAAISWQSSNPSVVSANGVVARPLKEAANATLTATISKDGAQSVTKTFDFTVAPLKMSLGSIPELMGVRSGDDFEDGTYDTDFLVSQTAAGSMELSDGKLKLTRSSSSGNSFLRFYANADMSEEEGEFYMEFLLSRSAAKPVLTRSYDATGKWGQNITAIDWAGDGSVTYYTGASTTAKLAASPGRVSKMKLGIYINSDKNTYSLWIDNALIAENLPTRAADISGFRYLQFYMDGTNYTTLGFEAYRLYNVWQDMPDSERIALDSASIVYDKLLTDDELADGIIDASLSLPTAGSYGSEITWSSSDDTVISSDGTLNRPSGGGLTSVTLTATVSSGSESTQKTFTFKVPGSELMIEEKMTVKELICYNDFESPYDNKVATDPRNYTDKFGIEDGRYQVTRVDATNNRTYLRLYPTAYANVEAALSGVMGIEMTLTKDKPQILKAVLTAVEGTYLTIEWQASGNMVLGHSDTPDGPSTWLNLNRSFGIDEELHIECLLDTRRSMYTLWLNDELVAENKYARTAGCGTYHYTEVTTDEAVGTSFTVDDHKVYYAMPPTLSRIDYDYCTLTEKSILTAEPVMDNYIDAPLNLYTQMDFGTAVEWKSSRPDIINPLTGELNRPVDSDEDIPVTLTAYLTNSGMSREISFDFIVLRELSTVDARESADADVLNEAMLTSETPDEITLPLNLISKGIYGSSITWSSSNESVIAPSGKVTRPRWNSEAVSVTLTATIAGKYTRTFDFVVKADEKLTDPQRTTDAEFFGVWNGSGWTTAPLLNYEYSGMEKVGEAAKDGDYAKAKEELFAHMKNRNVSSPVSLNSRNAMWVNALVADIGDSQSAAYHASAGTVTSNEYEKLTFSISNTKVTTAESRSYGIISKYNDTTEVTVAGTAYPDESMRPKMVLYVNGTPRTYKAVAATTVRTGDYMDVPYGRNDELKVKMFGDFLGNDTYRTYIQFDFTDIKDTDTIGKGELTVYAKKSTDYSEDKELLLLHDTNVGWDETNLTWKDLTTYVHNYNGITGGKTWTNVIGADVEYAYQSCRFYGYREMMREYLYTKDELYSYTAVKHMMDFICDSKYGHPRTLDTACRIEAWLGMFNYVLDTKWADADICTAILKTMYKDKNVLMTSNATTANWIQTEKLNAYYCAAFFPEFADSESVKQQVVDIYANMIKNDYYSDGAYIEDTAGYNTGALSTYIKIKKAVMDAGGAVSEEYDSILRKGAYYNLYLFGPAGEALGYGDNAPTGTSRTQKYADLSGWYNDYELLYIDTFGAKGTEPSWTSAHLPHSTYTFMRSDWSKTASYLFTNVRNGGTHGHYDDNGIILFAYGRKLLADAGYVTYTSGDDRDAAVSTKMHSTVAINEENHKSVTGYLLKDGNQGEVHNWTTNSEYDFLSQTTKGYTHIGNSHRRTITFVKPGYWIVSDLCTPTDKTEVNNYKQLWHMVPGSGLTIDEESGIIKSGFASGANIAIASADSDAAVKEDVGVYTASYGLPAQAPYGYYEKNVSGDASFDTVLLAYEGTSAKLDTERIELGVPATEATAMKFVSNAGDGETITYYMLDYAYAASDGRTFGNYTSDGLLTVVTEDSTGSINQILLNNGSKVTDSQGNTVIDFGQTVTDMAVEAHGSTLQLVTSDESFDITKVTADLGTAFAAVTVNGEYKDFTADGTVLSFSGEAAEEIIKNDNNANLGIKEQTASSQGGSGSAGGSAGGIGGGSVIDPGTVTPPADNLPFNDISQHWAQDNIIIAYVKGYINGYDDGTFRPDNSITRAEFTAIVCRALKVADADYSGQFADVSADDWYAPYIAAALNDGIISQDVNFRPNDTITREEMCKILAIALQNGGVAPAPSGYTPQFTDMQHISDWAKEYVYFASYHGFMSGREDGSFAPKANATRAEAATVLSRVPEI